MKLNLNESETELLLQMVYVGNYVINAERADSDKTAHELLAEKLYSHYLTEVKQISEQNVTDNKIAEVRERLIDETENFMETYEEAVRKSESL